MIKCLLFLAAIPSVAAAQPANPPHRSVTRTDLQRHDLSIVGWETVQTIVGFGPGMVAPKHKHPGEEIVYVLEGSIEYSIEGRAPVILKASDVLFIPFGVVHSARNVGNGHAAELATYVVEKGKPLVVLAN